MGYNKQKKMISHLKKKNKNTSFQPAWWYSCSIISLNL